MPPQVVASICANSCVGTGTGLFHPPAVASPTRNNLPVVGTATLGGTL